MKAHELKTLLSNLLSEADATTKLAVTAEKAKKSLNGHGPYADKFHTAVVAITSTERKVRTHLPALELSADELDQFDTYLAVLKNTATKKRERLESLRAFKLLCETVILHRVESMTASPIPATESVIPMDVVREARRGFIEVLATQINGCYERQWYDACSVMLRKLGEFLIVAVYENKGNSHEIKDSNGSFLQLSRLIEHIRTKTHWNLNNRCTLPCLEEMKKVGDRAAHTRYYVSKKTDVDNIIKSGLRVAVDDLLHHAGFK